MYASLRKSALIAPERSELNALAYETLYSLSRKRVASQSSWKTYCSPGVAFVQRATCAALGGLRSVWNSLRGMRRCRL